MLIEAAVNGEVELVTSPALVEELREVLAKPHLASKIAGDSRIGEAIQLYESLAIRATPLEVPRVVAADPDDDHVLACAVASRADILVSGDRDLLALAGRVAIPVLSPAAALERLPPRKS
jgi:uncharacterized protein